MTRRRSKLLGSEERFHSGGGHTRSRINPLYVGREGKAWRVDHVFRSEGRSVTCDEAVNASAGREWTAVTETATTTTRTGTFPPPLSYFPLLLFCLRRAR